MSEANGSRSVPGFVQPLLFAFACGVLGVLAGSIATADRADHVVQINTDSDHVTTATGSVAGRMGLLAAQTAVVGAFTLTALAFTVLGRLGTPTGAAPAEDYQATLQGFVCLVALLWPIAFVGLLVAYWEPAWRYELTDRAWPKVLVACAGLKAIAWGAAAWAGRPRTE